MTRFREAPDSGASAVEYGLLVTAIAGVIMIAVFAFGSVVRSSFTHSCTRLSTGSTAQCK